MKKVIAIAGDTEFTCWDKAGGDILCTGLVEIFDDFTLGRELEVFSRPDSSKYFTAGAQAVHGISYFKAQTFPTRRESCMTILNWLKPHIEIFPLPFIYHGTGKLDHAWLHWHFRKEELENSWVKAFPESLVESTLKLAKEHLKLLPAYNLKEIGNYYGMDMDDHHSALPDARKCAQIYCNIMKGVGTWTGKLL